MKLKCRLKMTLVSRADRAVNEAFLRVVELR